MINIIIPITGVYVLDLNSFPIAFNVESYTLFISNLLVCILNE